MAGIRRDCSASAAHYDRSRTNAPEENASNHLFVKTASIAPPRKPSILGIWNLVIL
jgi:hypothetical protein